MNLKNMAQNMYTLLFTWLKIIKGKFQAIQIVKINTLLHNLICSYSCEKNSQMTA